MCTACRTSRWAAAVLTQLLGLAGCLERNAVRNFRLSVLNSFFFFFYSNQINLLLIFAQLRSFGLMFASLSYIMFTQYGTFGGICSICLFCCFEKRIHRSQTGLGFIVVMDDLESLVLLLLPTDCLDYKCAPSCLVHAVLGLKPRALCT